MFNPTRLLPYAIILTGLALLAVLFLWNPPAAISTRDDAPQGGNFTLNSADGPVSLSDFHSRVVVLYFGYTRCPDICPTSLALLTQALNMLTEKELSNIQAIFISVDPERDDLTYLKTYTNYFHSKIMGVTGNPEEVRRIATLYGAAYRKVKSDSAMGYLVDHSANLYLIDPKGKLHTQLAHGTSAIEIKRALTTLLNSVDS